MSVLYSSHIDFLHIPLHRGLGIYYSICQKHVSPIHWPIPLHRLGVYCVISSRKSSPGLWVGLSFYVSPLWHLLFCIVIACVVASAETMGSGGLWPSLYRPLLFLQHWAQPNTKSTNIYWMNEERKKGRLRKQKKTMPVERWWVHWVNGCLGFPGSCEIRSVESQKMWEGEHWSNLAPNNAKRVSDCWWGW